MMAEVLGQVKNECCILTYQSITEILQESRSNFTKNEIKTRNKNSHFDGDNWADKLMEKKRKLDSQVCVSFWPPKTKAEKIDLVGNLKFYMGHEDKSRKMYVTLFFKKWRGIFKQNLSVQNVQWERLRARAECKLFGLKLQRSVKSFLIDRCQQSSH
jgi:hypothetical protein